VLFNHKLATFVEVASLFEGSQIRMGKLLSFAYKKTVLTYLLRLDDESHGQGYLGYIGLLY